MLVLLLLVGGTGTYQHPCGLNIRSSVMFSVMLSRYVVHSNSFTIEASRLCLDVRYVYRAIASSDWVNAPNMQKHIHRCETAVSQEWLEVAPKLLLKYSLTCMPVLLWVKINYPVTNCKTSTNAVTNMISDTLAIGSMQKPLLHISDDMAAAVVCVTQSCKCTHVCFCNCLTVLPSRHHSSGTGQGWFYK